MSTTFPLPSSPHWAPRTMMFFTGSLLFLERQIFCGGNVRQLAQLREDLLRNRVVHVDERDGGPARLLPAELQARDVDPLLAEERSDAPDHAGDVEVRQHQHPAGKFRVDREQVDLHDAGGGSEDGAGDGSLPFPGQRDHPDEARVVLRLRGGRLDHLDPALLGHHPGVDEVHLLGLVLEEPFQHGDRQRGRAQFADLAQVLHPQLLYGGIQELPVARPELLAQVEERLAAPPPPRAPAGGGGRRSGSLIRAPRAQLMMHTPFFIFAIEAAHTMFFVSGVRGVWNVMKFDPPYSSSSETSSTPPFPALSLLTYGSYPITTILRPRARSTTTLPMFPRPTTPRTLSVSSVPMNLFFSHFPCFIEASAWGSWRAIDIISAMACSPVVTVFPPGVFITTTPFLVAATLSMLSVPLPARPITLTRETFSKTMAVAFAPPRTAR